MSNYNLETTDYNIIYPQNLRKYKNLEGLSLVLEKELKKNIISKVSKLAIIKNLELQDDNVLNELAHQFQIENWDDNFSKEMKIGLIKIAYWAHSKKGTRGVIEKELANLGYNLKLEEWWEYQGNPFTFRIKTEDVVKNENWINSIVKKINKVKNVRSHLDIIKNSLELKRDFKISAYKEMIISKEIFKLATDLKLNSKVNIKAYRQIIKEDL